MIMDHPRIKFLTRKNLGDAPFLVTAVVTKSSGVFLWVFLIVKSLLDGLRKFDKLEDLYRRLEELQAVLDSLYSHVLSKMSPLYRQQAARLLQIMYQQGQLEFRNPMSTLHLAFSDKDNPKFFYRSSPR
jgi:hypothetical protein